MPDPVVFISYSHRDEEWKDRLIAHLAVLQSQRLLSLWHDKDIQAGEDWFPRLEGALRDARVAVLLVTAHFLSSKFILEEEIPRLLERRKREGLRIVPVLVRPCLWQKVPWLTTMQLRPTHAKALSAGTEHEVDVDLTEIAGEVLTFLAGIEESDEQEEPLPFRQVPRLLPFLADRDDQDYHLSKAWEKHQATRSSRPLVCVVHGDELQCHDKFLERLKEVTLPRTLVLDPKGAAINEFHLDWPSTFDGSEDLEERLKGELAERVLNRSLAPVNEIQQALAQIPGPVVMHTHLLSDDWVRHGSAVLDGFLKLWNDWPDLRIDQQHFAFLFIKYQRSSRQSTSSRWLNVLTGPFIRRRSDALNRSIKETLESYDFSRFSGLTCTVLPGLDDVNQTDAENWGRNEGSRFCRAQSLVGEISALYKSWRSRNPATAIPMEYLATELDRILRKYQARKESVA